MAKNSVSLHVYMVHIVCLLTNTVQLLHPPKWCLTRHGRGTYQYTRVYSLTMEKAMAPHASTLAWKIPWMEEPGGLQSMGSLRVGHDWATSLSLFTFKHWRRKWQPTPVFLPGGSQGWGSVWAAVYGVAQSRTRLKWLSIALHSITLLRYIFFFNHSSTILFKLNWM